MIIKPAQIQAFSGAQSHRFIQDTLRRLRETEPLWTEDKSDGELCVQLEEMVSFAASCRIRKRDAVLAIIDAFVHFRPVKPYDTRLIEILQRPNVPEVVRAEQFYLSLASGRHLLKEIALIS
jgi:hypothetical protein